MSDELADLKREVQVLQDYEAIRQLLYRYARGVDRADLELIQSVYATDGTDQHGPYDGPGEEFAHVVVDSAKKVWDHVGNHHITNHYIELDGDEAKAEVYFIAYHPHVDDGTPKLGIISGRYLDRLVRENGRWGIKRRIVMTDFTLNDFYGEPWKRTTPEAGYVKGLRGRVDKSYELFG